jgi:xanthine dehydrogenase accessory factor
MAVEGSYRYVGMIGSRRKIETVFRGLRERGVPEETIGRVRAPIGLDIGAETPAEIAVSIVAELIRERHAAGSTARRAGPPGRPFSS